MVIISFNSDMDGYLSRRKREYRNENPVDKVENSQPSSKKGMMERLTNLFSDEDETMGKNKDAQDDESERDEGKAGKKGIFHKIKNWLSFDDEDESYEENIPKESNQPDKVDIKYEELKDALKIQNKWLKQLPSNVIREFKSSDDYKRYKEILEKHNMIKK